MYIRGPNLSEKFMRVVHKAREQQRQKEEHLKRKKGDEVSTQPTTATMTSSSSTSSTTIATTSTTPTTETKTMAQLMRMAREEIEMMGNAIDMIKENYFMLPQITKTPKNISFQKKELGLPLSGKMNALLSASERLRKVAQHLEDCIAKDHEGYFYSFPIHHSLFSLLLSFSLMVF